MKHNVKQMTKIVVFPLILLCSNFIWGQYPNIQVNYPGNLDPEEVTIAINPVNPLNLAAGANLDYYYYSMDGGYTWNEGRLQSFMGVWGDPCVTFDPLGNLYYGHLSRPNTYPGSWLDQIVIQKSVDGGETWNAGSGTGLNGFKDQDKEWLIADHTESPYHGNLYVSWTQFDDYGSYQWYDSTRIRFSKSTDQGESWSGAITISDQSGDCLDGDNTVEGAVPAVGPDGEIYIAWSGPLGIMFDKSTDGGVTFGKDIFVTQQPGGWNMHVWGINRCNGLPVTVCDISNSPYRGRIYVLWADQRNGDFDTDVFLVKSDDGGATWGGEIRVNDDDSERHQFFPWITVDPITGVVWAVFYDRRDTAGDATDVYVAKSIDGGETFTNFKISESSFIPVSNIFFGDYINIAAYDGKVYPIWMRLHNLDLSVWTVVIEDSVMAHVPEENGLINSFHLSQNYPNPFNSTTSIAYQLDKTSRVHLAVYNSKGQLVETLTDEVQAPGAHTIDWYAAAHGSGIYFYRISADSRTLVRKCLYLK